MNPRSLLALIAVATAALGAGYEFPSGGSKRSPDGKRELTCTSADGGQAGHSLWLKKAGRPGFVLRRFSRHCDSLWSPDSSRIAVTDWWASDRACYGRSVLQRRAASRSGRLAGRLPRAWLHHRLLLSGAACLRFRQDPRLPV